MFLTKLSENQETEYFNLTNQQPLKPSSMLKGSQICNISQSISHGSMVETNVSATSILENSQKLKVAALAIDIQMQYFPSDKMVFAAQGTLTFLNYLAVILSTKRFQFHF